jgi:hypothetical protein
MLTTKKSRLLSDQYDNWSAILAETITPVSPESTQKPPAPAAALVCHPPRLAHRAIQTLRQTRMQMRTGTGTRPKVLPLHQPAGSQAGDGLHSTGGSRYGRSLHRELSFGPRDSRSDLQYQSRTAPSQGASIEKRRVHRKSYILGWSLNRSPPGGHSHRQHAGNLAPSKASTQISWRNQG